MQSQEKIDEFWVWFSGAADVLASLYVAEDAASLARLLDQRVENLAPGCVWELGPGIERPYFFALSPAGDLGKLAMTREATARAPHMDDWEFHCAKPPKVWDLRFEILDRHGHSQWIDARDWRYALTSFGGGQSFDVVLHSPHPPTLESDDFQTAAGILLEGILGEETVLERIGAVRFVVDPDHAKKAKTGAVSVMRKHIASLVERAVIRNRPEVP